MPSGRNKTRKRKGGKLVDYGSFGCVYSPSIRCESDSDPSTAQSSDKRVTKYMNYKDAEEEIDIGIMIEEVFEEAGYEMDPFEIILYPRALCSIPTDLTPAELAENPVHECPVKVQNPTLAQMINGGENLLRFVCPPKDVRIFLESILSLTAKLETLHVLNLAHLDIKMANIVTKKVNNIYKTRFIDVGFVKHLDTYSTDEPFLNFGNDYMIWPFETRFLIKDITTINFAGNEANVVKIIQHFANSIHTRFTQYNIPLLNYFPNNQFIFLDSTGTKYSDIFKLNINYLLKIYAEKGNKQDVIREIGKLTDVYSLGLVLYEIYSRISNQKLDQNLGVSPRKPITNEKEYGVYMDLFQTVTIDYINLILRITAPHIESRERSLATIRAQLIPLFQKIAAIYTKYYP